MANGSTERTTADGEVWVQLATRIPKTLHRQLKVHCVKTDESLMGFVVAALEEKLAKVRAAKKAS